MILEGSILLRRVCVVDDVQSIIMVGTGQLNAATPVSAVFAIN
jgi:hypothetical protein